MRHTSPKRTEKLKQAILQAKLSEARAKAGGPDTGSGGPAEEEAFAQKLGDMPREEALEYAMQFMPPPCEAASRRAVAALQIPIKMLLCELAEDLLTAYRHDVMAGDFDERDFLRGFIDALTDDALYAPFWEARELSRKFRFDPDGSLNPDRTPAHL